MATIKTFILDVAVDLGSSCTKAIGIYKKKDEDEESIALVLSPHFLEIEPRTLNESILNFPTEKRCWISLENKTYAVGELGRNLGGIAPFKPLKADSAGIKVLGALAAVMYELGIAGKRINSIRLTFLLPPGEFLDRKRVTEWLIESLKSFDSAFGKISFQTSQVVAQPEGFGVLEFCKHKGYIEKGRSTLVMGGHRNISMYTIDDGIPVEKFTLDRGFNDWVKAVDAQTSGYSGDLDILGSLMAAYYTSKHPEPEIFSSILRRQSPREREEETDMLLEVIDRTRGTFWRSVVSWLQENHDRNSKAAIFAGGMAHVFAKEFNSHFRPLIPERQNGMSGKYMYFDRDLFSVEDVECLKHIPVEYRLRFIDVYCSLKYLFASIVILNDLS
jgi:hypothetical protein